MGGAQTRASDTPASSAPFVAKSIIEAEMPRAERIDYFIERSAIKILGAR